MAMLNTLDGVRDETGRSMHPYAQWTRWVAWGCGAGRRPLHGARYTHPALLRPACSARRN